MKRIDSCHIFSVNRKTSVTLRLRAVIKSKTLGEAELYSLLLDPEVKSEVDLAIEIIKPYIEKTLNAKIKAGGNVEIVPGCITILFTFFVTFMTVVEVTDFVLHFQEKVNKIGRTFEGILYAIIRKIPDPKIHAQIDGGVPSKLKDEADRRSPLFFHTLMALLVTAAAGTYWQVTNERSLNRPPATFKSDSAKASCKRYVRLRLHDGSEILVPPDCIHY